MSNNLWLKYSGLYCSAILGYVPPVAASVCRWTIDHYEKCINNNYDSGLLILLHIFYSDKMINIATAVS